MDQKIYVQFTANILMECTPEEKKILMATFQKCISNFLGKTNANITKAEVLSESFTEHELIASMMSQDDVDGLLEEN